MRERIFNEEHGNWGDEYRQDEYAVFGEYAGREPSYHLPPRLVERSLRFRAVRKSLSGAPPESIVYLNHPVTFDTTQATALLGRHGLRCPRFGEYVGPVVRFFREHEDDPAYVPLRT